MFKTAVKKIPWKPILLFFGFLVLSMFPLITQKPYPPQDTSDVILNLLMASDVPYAALAPIFHIATLLLAGLILWQPGKWGRLMVGYIGVNYLILIVTCGMGNTEKYGFVAMTGALVLYAILGITWLTVAFRNRLQATLREPTILEWGLCLLALLAFWGPYTVVQGAVQPDLNPLLLITSPDYGLMFCFTTPVFLMGLILCYPSVPLFAFRITAINAFIYALFNLSHWFYPERWWMGVLHLPLLLISLYALLYPRIYSTSKDRRVLNGARQPIIESPRGK
jgi:hypothetical protein